MYLRLAFLAFGLFFLTGLSGQDIFLTTLDSRLYRLDLSDCSYEQLASVPQSTTDITFHPNGKLYALNSTGRLVELNPINGMVTFVHQYTQNTFYTALTAAADGRIYATGAPGLLSSFNPATGEEIYHGDIGFDAAGDLSFYQGTLYMASYSDDIVRVDIENPANSSIAINGSVSGDIFGIVSYAANCSDVTTYALTNNNTDIYEINFATGTLDLYCSLPLNVGGGASTFEFFGSSPIEIVGLDFGDFQCASATGFIEVQSAGGVGELSYSLDSISFQSSGLFTGLPPGEYVAYVRDANGCTAVDTLILDLEQPVSLNLELEPATCGLDNGTLTVDLLDPVAPPYAVLLDGQGPATATSFTDLAPGNYTLIVSDVNGCERVEAIVVEARTPIVIDNITAGDTRCGLRNGGIVLAASEGAMPYSFQLNNGPTQDSTIFFGLPAGEYTVVAIDADQCRDSVQVSIANSDAPQIETLISDTLGCTPAGRGTLLVEATGGSGGYTYQLTDGSPFVSSPVFEEIDPGSYSVRVRDSENCLSEPVTAVVQADPTPQLAVEAITPAACGSDNGTFVVTGAGGTGSLRATLGGRPVALAQPVQNLSPGDYSLRLVDALGCSDTLSVTIPAGDCPVYLPSAFSPNNDGKNDVFRPQFWPGANATVLEFSIYDRWGGELYRAGERPITDADLGWDGRARGQVVATGTYLYVLLWRNASGRVQRHTGEIVLLR